MTKIYAIYKLKYRNSILESHYIFNNLDYTQYKFQ